MGIRQERVSYGTYAPATDRELLSTAGPNAVSATLITEQLYSLMRQPQGLDLSITGTGDEGALSKHARVVPAGDAFGALACPKN